LVVALACDVSISLLLLTCEKADSFSQSCGAFFLFVKWYWRLDVLVLPIRSARHAQSTLSDLTEYKTNLQAEPAQLVSPL
jgi:hypothetical protein